ncbi:DNA polymerase-3 subunit beta [Angulomicrobium tetraedrale]|uniref:Beta sliding clamp n=1 Tax=Ancylobacter tetraedralis TaxID=217068 RepID=A0A839ZA16_9HYPH|nr:DNA polymerase III subunit beta [Ancylobacter tetraedralis]MBB3771567.1 DNA polymerase-3 subunit beta [Ancylobacter tetraedralis]
MKLTLDRAPLLAALTRAHRVVERKNTIAILSHLRLTATAGAMVITATDLDIEMTQSVPADIETAGSTTVSAATLFEIARKLPEGAQIKLEADGDRGALTLRAGRSRFTLQTLPDSDFPDLAALAEGVEFALPGAALAAAIGRVSFAISTEETRYYLGGIYLHLRQTQSGTPRLAMVTTDGHRLSLTHLAVDNPPAQMPGIIVPRKAVAEIQRLAADADKADITLTTSTTKLAASFGGARLTTKLIDGSFPDYERVIPRGNTRIATLKAEDLRAAADRVSTVSNVRGNAVKFSFSSGKLELSVVNPDAGEATESLDCAFEGEGLAIGFNSRYVVDVIGNTAPKGDVEIALADPGSPTIFRHPDAQDDLCVLMPMRV